ncbi:xylulokinase [Tersicoccus solisilvae]|uniref:Xylulose kinase n=1 Tax=Tersicoccus solisilvae TaxID=1882339 RepID=A0ABQ1P1V7_9MICC|nr:xylulokinase [Tersicoccus solisilvae]GGC88700.1 xylulokinase [Tersicoccus solisilvae]
MTLVAGVDSSTQSCKVVIRDAATGALVRAGAAPHPDGTEVDPEAWWSALQAAVEDAGGLDGVTALAVGGQQHGLVALDADGEVIRPALLWNDTRSADAAEDLVRELGDGDAARGRAAWLEATGSVPVASFTVTKLRWLADHEPEHAARLAAVALPHDWLTWRLSGSTDLATLTTDRSDASGTGYWDPATGAYRWELLSRALRRDVGPGDLVLPRVAEAFEAVGETAAAGAVPAGIVLGPGCGDNAGAALGLGLAPGQVFVSLGTSGVVAAVAQAPTTDPSGVLAGFADATGAFLPLACTLNATRVLEAARRLLGVDHEAFSDLALAALPGAGGLVHVPYLEGERTPDLPRATGSLHGMTPASLSRENLARAAVEGLLCHLAAALDVIRARGVDVTEVTLVGGGARSAAVRQLAPGLLGVPVVVPPPGEYVADGAARQAATVAAGSSVPVAWAAGEAERFTGPAQPDVRAAYDRQAARAADEFGAPAGPDDADDDPAVA